MAWDKSVLLEEAHTMNMRESSHQWKMCDRGTANSVLRLDRIVNRMYESKKTSETIWSAFLKLRFHSREPIKSAIMVPTQTAFLHSK